MLQNKIDKFLRSDALVAKKSLRPLRFMRNNSNYDQRLGLELPVTI
jgi:hypothetical protein